MWVADKIALQMQEMLKLEAAHGKDFRCLSAATLPLWTNNYRCFTVVFKHRKQSTDILNDSYKLIAHSTITGCTMLLNRAAIRVAVPIRINNFQQDHWIGMHVAYYGKISCIEQPLVLYRQHSSNVVGASKISLQYLLSRLVIFQPYQRLVAVKAKASIPVPVAKVFLFKIWYNASRLLKR